jgi:hypothetical protein
MNQNLNQTMKSLTDPQVADAIARALLAMGVKRQDVQDGVQDVYVQVLAAFRRGAAIPADLRNSA